ncbi:MAG: hypothetical protein U9Q69_03540 [Nanoarchaeota archaeon]|nr:hypothetical protein [Nanoarchaeota archaeon]
MAKREPKDIHDYFNIYGILFLTLLITIGTLFAAYAAFIKIPEKIDDISIKGEWDKFYYKEAMEWKNREIIGNLDDALMKGCKTIEKESEITLDEVYIKCKNNDKKLPIIITKDKEDNCLWKIQGTCGK